ncbi:hypothetical protein EV361DRAFT_891916 [Lentinula raphanica]|nr:hypothetical protein EV361DRAFT_891916 [Lentinula raphanica]
MNLASYSRSTTPLSGELTELIPHEIYDYIISFLDDGLTLKSCSLTCRAWLKTSWKCLFAGESLVVHRDNIYDLLEIIERDIHTVTIIRFVERLYIEQGGSRRLPFGIDDGDTQVFQFDEFLSRLVGFKSVRMLRLGWIRGDIGPPTMTSLQNNFGAGVTSLELNSVVLRSVLQFFEILHALPRLTSLTLAGLSLAGGLEDYTYYSQVPGTLVALVQPETTPRPPQLNELCCNVVKEVTKFIFSWLVSHGSIPIQTLAVGLFDGPTNYTVSHFLAESGSAIETVKLWDAYTATGFDLSPCTNLRTLRMGWIHLSSTSPPGSETFVTDVLKTVSSTCLEEVLVVVQILISNSPGVDRDLAAFDWKGLVSVLQHPRFQSLRRFHFAVPSHAQVVVQSLMKHIKPVVASGKLPFDPSVFSVVGWSRSEYAGNW